MKTLFILGLLALATPTEFHGQHTADKPSAGAWWISPRDSPLSLSLSRKGRYLDLVNVSSEVVVSHTLGCVVEIKGNLHIEKALEDRKRELKPGEGLLELTRSYRDRYYSECENPASKLAVVKVRFASGHEWSVAESNDGEERTGGPPYPSRQ
jgi:hypothetical protein